MNKNLFILCLLLAGIFCRAQGNSWAWAKSAQGNNSDNTNCIAIDPSGNIIAVGFFYSSTIIFGTYTLTNSGNYDLFVVKYDASGNVLWATGAGGIYDDVACGVTTDASGNVYVTGYFYSPVLSLTNFNVTNSGAGDCFIVKYDSNGNEQWINNIGDTGDENALGITADPSGNICITGFFQSPALYLNSYTLTSSGNRDVFIIKYNSSGNLLWANSAGGTASDSGQDICSDVLGNFFVTGLFYSAPFIAGSYTLSSSGSSDAFLFKVDGAGNILWANSAGGGFNDAGYSLKNDPSGNIFVTGGYLSPVFSVGTNTFSNSGGFDLFIAKYDNTGNLLWSIVAGGGQDDIGYGTDTDGSGNLYVTGHFHSPSINLGNTTLSNSGIGDMFVLKCDPGGTILWAESAGGTTDDGGGSVASDAAGTVYVSGYFFSSSITFSGTTLYNTGSDDVFLAKLQTLPTIIEKDNKQMSISIYPNPCHQWFKITNPPAGSVFHLINSLGEQVPVIFQKNNEGNIIVNNQYINPGLYFLVINSGNAVLFNRIVIQ